MRTAQFVAVLPIVAGTPVMSDEAFDLGQQAAYCWNLPSKYEDRAVVTFDITFDATGNVTDIAVIEYEPTGEAGRDAVVSASLAIEKCAPYPVSGPATKRIRMEYLQEEPINPFKKG